jgi:hypothetical protein
LPCFFAIHWKTLLIFIFLEVFFLQPAPNTLYFIFITFTSSCFFHLNFIICVLTYWLTYKERCFFLIYVQCAKDIASNTRGRLCRKHDMLCLHNKEGNSAHVLFPSLILRKILLCKFSKLSENSCERSICSTLKQSQQYYIQIYINMKFTVRYF